MGPSAGKLRRAAKGAAKKVNREKGLEIFGLGPVQRDWG